MFAEIHRNIKCDNYIPIRNVLTKLWQLPNLAQRNGLLKKRSKMRSTTVYVKIKIAQTNFDTTRGIIAIIKAKQDTRFILAK